MKLKYNIELDINPKDEKILLPYGHEIITREIGGDFKQVLSKDERIKNFKIEGIELEVIPRTSLKILRYSWNSEE